MHFSCTRPGLSGTCPFPSLCTVPALDPHASESEPRQSLRVSGSEPHWFPCESESEQLPPSPFPRPVLDLASSQSRTRHTRHTTQRSGCNPLPSVASTVAMCSCPMVGSCACLSKPLTPLHLPRQLAIQRPQRRRQVGPASGRSKNERPALPLASGRGAWARRHRPFHPLHPPRRPRASPARCGRTWAQSCGTSLWSMRIGTTRRAGCARSHPRRACCAAWARSTVCRASTGSSVC